MRIKIPNTVPSVVFSLRLHHYEHRFCQRMLKCYIVCDFTRLMTSLVFESWSGSLSKVRAEVSERIIWRAAVRWKGEPPAPPPPTPPRVTWYPTAWTVFTLCTWECVHYKYHSWGSRRAPGEMWTASAGALKQPTSVTAGADTCECSTWDRARTWCSRAHAATVLAALYPLWCLFYSFYSGGFSLRLVQNNS